MGPVGVSLLLWAMLGRVWRLVQVTSKVDFFLVFTDSKPKMSGVLNQNKLSRMETFHALHYLTSNLPYANFLNCGLKFWLQLHVQAPTPAHLDP